ncbi:vWA domain-containing protein [Rhizobium sp. NPDC090275]|uniref:vWA domain-containing protein n=1 Tax=Rhizobium sp. NPDC090275 TaxID=3364498 RepID=UPI00383AEF08
MYQLDMPWALLLLPLPLLVWWLVPAHRETAASVRLAFFDQVARAAGVEPTVGSVVPRRSRAQIVIDVLVWCLIVVALARPQYVEPPLEKTEPQRDILLALDLSQSMDTRDFVAPDGALKARVDAVRTVVADFVAKRPGDRIGLIAFGDAPYPLAPFTMDHALVETLVEGLLPGIAGPRTALGDTLGLGIRMFEKTTVPEKVMILLTDGNDTASKMPPLKAADIARTKSILIHAVGIGNPGATGEDKLDTPSLQKIAETTGGRYFFGGDQKQLQDIYDELDRITPQDQKQLSWRPRIELFHWPLGAAVAIAFAWYGLTGMLGLIRRRASA